MTLQETASRRTTLIMFLTLLVVTMAFTFHMVISYLVAVTMGAILAILTYPLYAKLRARKLGPQTASLLITLGVFILVVGPICLFVALSVRQGISVAESVTNNQDMSFHSIIERVSQFEWVQPLIGDPAAFEKQVMSSLQGFAKTATGYVVAAAAGLPGFLLQLALAAIACFFFLVDGQKFRQWMSDKIPLDRDVKKQLSESFKDTTISVIWATLAAAGAQAAVMLVSFLILGVPGAFLAAGATFVFAWIPMIGSVPVWVAGAVYLYTKGSIAKVVAMAILGLFTGIIDNFVRPWVLKGRGSMHPLVSLVVIFGGIEIFGITGVFLGPIIAAILITLLQIWPKVGNRAGVLEPSAEASLTTDTQIGEPGLPPRQRSQGV